MVDIADFLLVWLQNFQGEEDCHIDGVHGHAVRNPQVPYPAAATMAHLTTQQPDMAATPSRDWKWHQQICKFLVAPMFRKSFLIFMCYQIYLKYFIQPFDICNSLIPVMIMTKVREESEFYFSNHWEIYDELTNNKSMNCCIWSPV